MEHIFYCKIMIQFSSHYASPSSVQMTFQYVLKFEKYYRQDMLAFAFTVSNSCTNFFLSKQNHQKCLVSVMYFNSFLGIYFVQERVGGDDPILKVYFYDFGPHFSTQCRTFVLLDSFLFFTYILISVQRKMQFFFQSFHL